MAPLNGAASGAPFRDSFEGVAPGARAAVLAEAAREASRRGFAAMQGWRGEAGELQALMATLGTLMPTLAPRSTSARASAWSRHAAVSGVRTLHRVMVEGERPLAVASGDAGPKRPGG